MEMTYDDCEAGNVGHHEKCALSICALPNRETLPGTLDVANINLWSFDCSDLDFFAGAVWTLPLMVRTRTQDTVAADVSFGAVNQSRQQA